MTSKQTTKDAKAQGSKSQAASKKAAGKPAAKSAAKTEPKPKPTDLKSILRAMIKPLPPSQPKPPFAKGAGSPASNGAAKSTHATATGKLIAKPPTTAAAAKTAQRPLQQAGKAAAAKTKADGERQTEERGDPLLDLTDTAVKKMIARAKTRGFVTLDELNKVLPSERVSSEQIEDTMSMLSDMGINVVESEEKEEEGEGGAVGLGRQAGPLSP